jgi:DNA polymerase theta
MRHALCKLHFTDFILVSFDYSQLELRLMAHFSEDTNLVNILCAVDGDVFRMIGKHLYNTPTEAAVTSEQRTRVKQVCGHAYTRART